MGLLSLAFFFGAFVFRFFGRFIPLCFYAKAIGGLFSLLCCSRSASLSGRSASPSLRSGSPRFGDFGKLKKFPPLPARPPALHRTLQAFALSPSQSSELPLRFISSLVAEPSLRLSRLLSASLLAPLIKNAYPNNYDAKALKIRRRKRSACGGSPLNSEPPRRYAPAGSPLRCSEPPRSAAGSRSRERAVRTTTDASKTKKLLQS